MSDRYSRPLPPRSFKKGTYTVGFIVLLGILAIGFWTWDRSNTLVPPPDAAPQATKNVPATIPPADQKAR